MIIVISSTLASVPGFMLIDASGLPLVAIVRRPLWVSRTPMLAVLPSR